MKIVHNIEDIVFESAETQEERTAPVEYHFVGSQRKVPGHILFSYNTKTGELKQANIEREVSVDINLEPQFKTSVTREKDCIYIQALNEKNARKKLRKIIKK